MGEGGGGGGMRYDGVKSILQKDIESKVDSY